MSVLTILNDPPYGSERSYNGLRLAIALLKRPAAAPVTVFLMADAVLCAKRGQNPPDGYYNIERMLRRVIAAGGGVLLCGTCMAARGITGNDLVEVRSAATSTNSPHLPSRPTSSSSSESRGYPMGPVHGSGVWLLRRRRPSESNAHGRRQHGFGLRVRVRSGDADGGARGLSGVALAHPDGHHDARGEGQRRHEPHRA